MIKIYHNPNCSKSRAALALIRAANIEPQIVEYLHTPPSEPELRDLLAQLHLSPRELVREPERFADSHDDEIIMAILREPALMNRPIVVSERGACLCRPPELVLDLLP